MSVLGPLDVLALGGLVFVGSVVPVVPTGAVITAAAALAMGGHMSTLLWVVAIGGAGAFSGDVVTFAVSRLGNGRLHRWSVQDRVSALDKRVRLLRERGGLLITVSRLIPAGRLPTIAAAGLLKFPWTRFLVADAVGATLWVLLYAGLGVAGGSAFARPWVGAAVALAVVLAVEAGLHLTHRMRAARATGRRNAHATQSDVGVVDPVSRVVR